MSSVDSVIFNLTVNNDGFDFDCNISNALDKANDEIKLIEEKIEETEETIKNLTPDCDKIDYALAASSGAICGIIDVFLVGKPGESTLSNITDKWFADRTISFAKLCGHKMPDNCEDPLHNAIRFLEKTFKIPYDQSVGGDIFKELLALTPTNHHFKSLSHNPTLLGLFFSIMDQFRNTSSFVSQGDLITLNNSDSGFCLKGNSVPGKIFCGFVNWFGHIMSDISGSKSSVGRGMGIPSPIWAWTNDVIAIKRKLKIPVTEFDKSVNELAIEIFKEGYDIRFQSTQIIPVFINEMLVRFLYSARRLIMYFSKTPKENRSFTLLWKSCEPFSNATVKRMLTVAHGTFCLVDIGDATVRALVSGGGAFNLVEFAMRLNIVGIGRFAISLYGEVKREINSYEAKEELYFLSRERVIVDDYICGLNILAELYDDKILLTFIDDLKNSDSYQKAFEKTVLLAKMRKVPEEKILKNKSDIDSYFNGGI